MPARTAMLRTHAVGLTAAVLLAACASPPPAAVPDAPPRRTASPPPTPILAGVIAGGDRLALYAPRDGESYASIAAQLLGDESRAWEIAELNDAAAPMPGRPLVVPLQPVNAPGVRPDRYQTVPILCYHRIGTGNSRMSVSPANFAAQLEWLAANGYTVVEMRRLAAFLQGRDALPPRSVVITFDDGYDSVYQYAFPLLKKHRMPATVFLYTDFVGSGGALSWRQVQEMSQSGLIDIQAHSKTHANLIERAENESDAAYRQRIDAEVRTPREAITRRMPGRRVVDFAYPYGDANELVLDVLRRQDYLLAATVNPGGNPFYAQPLMLRRTMILGHHDLEAFKSRLVVSRPLVAP